MLDALLARYRRYGLPLPADSAPLVWLGPRKRVGFLLDRGPDAPRYLLGTQEFTWPQCNPRPEPVEPTPELADQLHPAWVHADDGCFPSNTTLALAIHCHARGWTALADRLLERGLREHCGRRWDVFHQPPGVSPTLGLAHLAWAHCGNELIKPGTDRAALAALMAALLDEEPGLATDRTRALLRSVQAALVPGRGAPGTIEWYLDTLVEAHGELGFSHQLPAGAAVLRHGLDAVPVLLDHFDDPRLTRLVSPAICNKVAEPVTVGDVVRGLLKDLAGQYRNNEVWASRADAEAWWRPHLTGCPEDFLVAQVLPPTAPWEVSPNPALLWLLGESYPHRLPEVYQVILDERPEVHSWEIARGILEGPLPASEKIELFVRAAAHPSIDLRRPALSALSQLHQGRFAEAMTDTLHRLSPVPTDPRRSACTSDLPDEYNKVAVWFCPETDIVQLVRQADDPRVWDTLAETAARSHVALRIEAMTTFHDNGIPDHRLPLEIAFLLRFFDDAEVRDLAAVEAEYDVTFIAAGQFPRLAVRDMAAMRAANLLKLQPAPQPSWTPDMWDDLRKRVRDQVSAEESSFTCRRG
jgi:hypothetical protein